MLEVEVVELCQQTLCMFESLNQLKSFELLLLELTYRLLSGTINLWSMLSASTVYLVVISVPSNTSKFSNLNTLFL